MNPDLIAAIEAISRADVTITRLVNDVDASANTVLQLNKSVQLLTEQNIYKDTIISNLRKRIADLENPVPAKPVETENQKSISIQVMPHRTDLPYYRQHDKILSLLGGLGIKRVRGQMLHGLDQTSLDFYRKAYEVYGIQSWLTIGEPRVTLTDGQWDSIQSKIDNDLKGMVAMVNGWNEPAHNRGGKGAPLTDWEKKTGIHQAELFKRFSTRIPVGSMQMWSGRLDDHDAHLRLVAPYVKKDGKPLFDNICWHLYQPGIKNFNRYKAIYTELFGNLPLYSTETGISTAPNQTSGALSTDEAGQADHLRTMIQMYRDNNAGINWFELHDGSNPDGTNREDWLGIVRADGTPKPAYNELKKFLV